MVVRHAAALLGGSLAAGVVRVDLRQPWDLFARPTVRSLINLAEPVAILMVAALHFVEDHEDPWAVVNCYKDLMAPGSYLVISRVTADHLSADAARRAHTVYEGASAPGVARSREQVARFFGGLDMLAPGLVKVSRWRPDVIDAPPGPALFYAGIGRKTSPGRAAPVTPGAGSPAQDDVSWREAARLRGEHRGWVIIWLAAEQCFRAYRRLPGARREMALSAATAGEMADLIGQAEQAATARRARSSPATP